MNHLIQHHAAASRRTLATFSIALGCCGGGAWAQQADCLADATPVNSIDMKVLVVSADGTEAVLPAIQATLDYVGVPYDTMIAKDQALTAESLCSAEDAQGHARYQGVILTTGSLGYLEPSTNQFESALTWEEWNLLWRYEAKYRVRQATLYTFPGGWPDTYGLTPPSAVDTSVTPLTTTLTSTSPTGSGNPTGRQVFGDLVATASVVIRHAYTYLAKPDPAAKVTPLLVDSAGNAIASIVNYPDGRKNLTVTADGNAHLLHTLSLGYGVVNWVTRGLYIGQRKVYLSAQPDDILLPNDMWDTAANSDLTGKTYRITRNDYTRFLAWQNARNNNNPGFIAIEFPFNASGAVAGELSTQELHPATTDDLTPVIRNNNGNFDWISHTYTHRNLNETSYTETLAELRQNDKTARNSLNLGAYWKDGLITPEISGLNNVEALRAMSDFGVRYIVSDTSRHCGHRALTTQPCPKPNTGIYNDLQPNILMVPRYPTNLFYNVCTPAEWTSEYNHIYRSFWGRDLTYQEILGKESDVWLQYMLRYDMRPVMFHQPNVCAYDGVARSLLADLIDATMAKYAKIYKLPVQSRRLRQIGNLMSERMAVGAAMKGSGARLVARIVPGALTSSIVVTNPTASSVIVPLTGVNWTGATSRETYGGQPTSKVTVGANAQVTVPGAPAW